MAEAADSYRGRVVIVTGASAGLGRQYALDFGRRGACVVVHGRSDATNAVANELAAAGGRAFAVRADAEDGEAIVAAALREFRRIDAIIANAGGVRDRSYGKLTNEDWDEVIRVHLGAARAITAAAWPHMTQCGGHIVLTTSSAGLFGRFGQTNYAAAKAGLIGLALSLAREGERFGIRVNAIAPWAATKMTEPAFGKAMQDALPPEFVSPFVLALCHPDCTESGSIIEIGGGWAAKLRWERAAGLRLPRERLSPECVLEHWARIGDFSQGTCNPRDVADTMPMLGLPVEAQMKQ